MSDFDELKFLSEYEEFQCGICQGVVDNPHFTPCCRQTYCYTCITEWLKTSKTCPYDRKELHRQDLRESERAFVNLLQKSKFRSNDYIQNCSQQLVRVGTLSQHLKSYVTFNNLSSTNAEIALLRDEIRQLKSVVQTSNYPSTSLQLNPNGYLSVEWVDSSHGAVPSNAVSGGHEPDGHTLYVTRAEHCGDIIPGKLVPKYRKCYVPYEGREHEKTDGYQVLTNPSGCELAWVSASNGHVPNGSIQGGRQRNGEDLYIGRAEHRSGSLVIGKVHPSHRCAYISWDHKEFSAKNYEVLVCKTIKY